MKKIAILLSKNYKLLSVAAILDVFETVNKFHLASNKEAPFDIKILVSEDQLLKNEEAFGYKLNAISTDERMDLILMPAFTTDDMKQTLQENLVCIPHIIKQYDDGASLGTFCTG
ncbi:MAG: AraC family transcriptional regulator, partial [Pedobacter sp.]